MDDLREKIEHALKAVYGHPRTASLAADFVMQVLREQEPIAKIHYDGYWTHAPGKDPLDQYSGKSQMEVFAGPMPASVPEEWREAVQEFVDRVDRGEIRSKYTYAKFQALLAAAQKPGE